MRVSVIMRRRTADWLHLESVKKGIGAGLFSLIHTKETTWNSQMLQGQVCCLSAANNTSPLFISKLSMTAKE